MEITIKGEKRTLEQQELTRKATREINIALFKGKEVDISSMSGDELNISIDMENAEKSNDLRVMYTWGLTQDEVDTLSETDYSSLLNVAIKKK